MTATSRNGNRGNANDEIVGWTEGRLPRPNCLYREGQRLDLLNGAYVEPGTSLRKSISLVFAAFGPSYLVSFDTAGIHFKPMEDGFLVESLISAWQSYTTDTSFKLSSFETCRDLAAVSWAQEIDILLKSLLYGLRGWCSKTPLSQYQLKKTLLSFAG